MSHATRSVPHPALPSLRYEPTIAAHVFVRFFRSLRYAQPSIRRERDYIIHNQNRHSANNLTQFFDLRTMRRWHGRYVHCPCTLVAAHAGVALRWSRRRVRPFCGCHNHRVRYFAPLSNVALRPTGSSPPCFCFSSWRFCLSAPFRRMTTGDQLPWRHPRRRNLRPRHHRPCHRRPRPLPQLYRPRPYRPHRPCPCRFGPSRPPRRRLPRPSTRQPD